MQTGHTWWAWLLQGLQVYLETLGLCKETQQHVLTVMLVAKGPREDEASTWGGTLGM